MTANVQLILQLFFMKGQCSMDTTLLGIQLPALSVSSSVSRVIAVGLHINEGGGKLWQIDGSHTFLSVLLSVHWPKTFHSANK